MPLSRAKPRQTWRRPPVKCHPAIAAKRRAPSPRSFQKKKRKKERANLRKRTALMTMQNWSVFMEWAKIITKTSQLYHRLSKEEKNKCRILMI